jgi:hypothetical protein
VYSVRIRMELRTNIKILSINSVESRKNTAGKAKSRLLSISSAESRVPGDKLLKAKLRADYFSLSLFLYL